MINVSWCTGAKAIITNHGYDEIVIILTKWPQAW